MVKRPRVVINSDGAKAVLTSAGVQSRIQGIVDGIAARANSMESTPRTDRGELYGFEPSTIQAPHSRAGGRVTAVGPTARRANAANNTLLKAMGGGS